MREEDVKTLIRYRLEEAKTALEDAECLIKGGRSSQSIVNRLYYAMFYTALALLQKIGEIPSKHTGVIGLFDQKFVVNGIFPKEMSKHFHRAFELRQTSDYKIAKPLPQRTIDELRGHATEFVEKVSGYLDQ